MDEGIKSEIWKFVLQNAVRFDGKADPKAIIGKVMGKYAILREDPDAAMREITEIVKTANEIEPGQQKHMLEGLAPEMLRKKKEKRRDIFNVLGISRADNVITAFPPGPEKYPHIGHAKACYFNYLIARNHNGRFILRFEDTNPKLVKKEFYDIMQEDFRWLGIDWDELMYASDHMDLFYRHAETLIRKGHAYVCTCNVEDIKKSRMKGRTCPCRKNDPVRNFDLWKKLPEMDEGQGILRLKIDMNHKNSAMRDPTIFRIIKTPHARQGDKYLVWPNYDFQNAIMDGEYKVSHRVRSKEFEMRSELQSYIQKLLKYNETITFEFARFNIEGVESSGRVIREKVESGELIGWDDPQLTTLAALRRRGFVPEAIKEFLLKTGMTKSESILTWDDLIMHNRRILDKDTDRMFFVEQPVRIHIEGTPHTAVRLKRHPEFPDRGYRDMDIDGDFYLAEEDIANIKDNKLYRLMDCINFRKTGDDYSFVSTDLDEYRKEGEGIFHFLPANMDLDEVEVMMPDHSKTWGKSEKTERLEEGTIVQFERYGFVRLDDKKEKRFWFTHR